MAPPQAPASPLTYAEQQQMSAADLAASSKTLSLAMPRTACTTPPEFSPRTTRHGFEAFRSSRFDSGRAAFSLPNLLDAISASRDTSPERQRDGVGSVYSFNPGCEEALLHGYVGHRAGRAPISHADLHWRRSDIFPCFPPALDETAVPPAPAVPAPVHPYERARSLVQTLWEELRFHGEIDPRSTVLEVLHTALTLLGEEPADPQGKPAMMVAHPDEFKNPSSFLKIYGDPLCFSEGGPLPRRGRNGNWTCTNCKNVNYPRRFRCHKCSAHRDANGDKIVADYARNVFRKISGRAGTGRRSGTGGTFSAVSVETS